MTTRNPSALMKLTALVVPIAVLATTTWACGSDSATDSTTDGTNRDCLDVEPFVDFVVVATITPTIAAVTVTTFDPIDRPEDFRIEVNQLLVPFDETCGLYRRSDLSFDPGEVVTLRVSRATGEDCDCQVSIPERLSITTPVDNQSIPLSQSLTVSWDAPSAVDVTEVCTFPVTPFTPCVSGDIGFVCERGDTQSSITLSAPLAPFPGLRTVAVWMARGEGQFQPNLTYEGVGSGVAVSPGIYGAYADSVTIQLTN